jgi:hypothetical protein
VVIFYIYIYIYIYFSFFLFSFTAACIVAINLYHVKPILMPSLGNQTVNIDMVFIVPKQQFYYVLLLNLADSDYNVHQ